MLEKQVMLLWADIQNRADARLERDTAQQSVAAETLKPPQKHFLGSLVLMPTAPSTGWSVTSLMSTPVEF